MKKIYTDPEMKIINILFNDVILSSPTENLVSENIATEDDNPINLDGLE